MTKNDLPLLSFLNSHASVRAFGDGEISDEDEVTIVRTAQRSPTSSNMQAYSIIGVRQNDTKSRLRVLTGDQAHVEHASLFLVFCADLFRLQQLVDHRGYGSNVDTTELFVVATVDATLAACRALMAAQALGYGGVMVGAVRNHPRDISELLRLPELVYPVMGMSLGVPAKPAKVKPRLPHDGIYHREQYDPTAATDAIGAYDRTIDALGYLRGREVRPSDYPEFTGTYSWSEHTARRVATPDPQAARLHLLLYLQERGFLKR